MLILFFHIKISEDFLYSHGYTLKLLELEPKIDRPARKVEPNSTKLSRSKTIKINKAVFSEIIYPLYEKRRSRRKKCDSKGAPLESSHSRNSSKFL